VTYTLTGRYPLGDLSGRPGRLRFVPSTTIVGDDNVILPAPVTVDLDADGAFSVALVGTDDTDYAPSGWVWTVTEMLDGGRAPWSFQLTADGDISDLTALTAGPVFLEGAAILVLDQAETVPAQTPVGTVILRRV
jgi:hypothetical protein